AQLRLPPRYDQESKRAQFYDEVLERAAALPGVVSVGATSQLPLTQYNMGGTLRVDDSAVEGGKREAAVPITAVNADYFRTLGIGLRSGRLFDHGDVLGAGSVALLSEALARQLFPNGDPVGRRIFVAGSGAEWTTVIGVVEDVRHQGLDRGIEPAAYLSYRQLPRPMMALVLRSSAVPSSLAASLRQAVSEVDPALPVFDVRTMKARISDSLAGRRFPLLLLGGFAALALLLAGIGIYGVIAYLVTERTREIGIRMALGAQQRNVLALVVGQGMRLALAGVGIGLAAALALSRVLRTLLFEVQPTDPLTFATIPLLLVTVALLACWLPARRAARVDPTEALRSE
ncbi:MAG: ABC transporter permease, partial [Verrucomicrobiae bacterium]|nr:ABC transporter permease [Verrucomicrobiae bacterium]